jgi:ubiquinone/menaquinone biosynthesis C-methylase UbiE
MAGMATEIDAGGIMPRAILRTADFRNARVLEVGAGDGRLTFQYAAEPRSAVGIDLKEPEIQSASKNSQLQFAGDVRFLCASATALPFSGGGFEIVLLASSL